MNIDSNFSQNEVIDLQDSVNRLHHELCQINKRITSGQQSDGFHTFNELYEFRMIYNAALFNEWSVQHRYDVHKSKRHNDGELCFDGEWFIVCAILPTGQISNHYELKDWDMFQCEIADKAKYLFDGHTPKDVISRIQELYK